MRIILRMLIILCLTSISFLIGWYSNGIVNEDPYLSALFQGEREGYTRFVNDLVDAIQKANSTTILLPLQEQNQTNRTNSNLDSSEELDDTYYLEPSSAEEVYLPQPQEKEYESDFIETEQFEIDPLRITQMITQQMSNQEKLYFLFWLRSRFNTEELERMNGLIQEGLTVENATEIYKNLRKNLRENDYEYLLSIADRFILTTHSELFISQEENPSLEVSSSQYGYELR